MAADEPSRLVRLEQSLTALWEWVEARGWQEERRHSEELRLYTDLQQQQTSAQSGLLDQHLDRLRTQLDMERQQREQVRYWTHMRFSSDIQILNMGVGTLKRVTK